MVVVLRGGAQRSLTLNLRKVDASGTGTGRELAQEARRAEVWVEREVKEMAVPEVRRLHRAPVTMAMPPRDLLGAMD